MVCQGGDVCLLLDDLFSEGDSLLTEEARGEDFSPLPPFFGLLPGPVFRPDFDLLPAPLPIAAKRSWVVKDRQEGCILVRTFVLVGLFAE
jgi:hypothetical protein